MRLLLLLEGWFSSTCIKSGVRTGSYWAIKSRKAKHSLWGFYILSSWRMSLIPLHLVRLISVSSGLLTIYWTIHHVFIRVLSCSSLASEIRIKTNNNPQSSVQGPWAPSCSVSLELPVICQRAKDEAESSPPSAGRTCLGDRCACVSLKARPTGLYSCHSCQSSLLCPLCLHTSTPPPSRSCWQVSSWQQRWCADCIRQSLCSATSVHTCPTGST